MALSVEQRVAALEKLVSAMIETSTVDMTNEWKRDAEFAALHSIIEELSVRAGLTEEEFAHHFEIRVRWFHDRALRKAEDISPARAAEIDQRTPEQADVSDYCPPLFDPQPPEHRD